MNVATFYVKLRLGYLAIWGLEPVKAGFKVWLLLVRRMLKAPHFNSSGLHISVISTLANFQLFSSRLVCIDGPIGH